MGGFLGKQPTAVAEGSETDTGAGEGASFISLYLLMDRAYLITGFWAMPVPLGLRDQYQCSRCWTR